MRRQKWLAAWRSCLNKPRGLSEASVRPRCTPSEWLLTPWWVSGPALLCDCLHGFIKNRERFFRCLQSFDPLIGIGRCRIQAGRILDDLDKWVLWLSDKVPKPSFLYFSLTSCTTSPPCADRSLQTNIGTYGSCCRSMLIDACVSKIFLVSRHVAIELNNSTKCRKKLREK
jgi:hypothetical protein